MKNKKNIFPFSRCICARNFFSILNFKVLVLPFGTRTILFYIFVSIFYPVGFSFRFNSFTAFCKLPILITHGQPSLSLPI